MYCSARLRLSLARHILPIGWLINNAIFVSAFLGSIKGWNFVYKVHVVNAHLL